ncbi:unnamed protein product [Ilex paraguariensis]|uniref:Thg1 C-terminal domain-containing protein n=1 Tax=Ilex paraguariensis TaxID=185542 RepID=A0ABC8QZI4_9AQUA
MVAVTLPLQDVDVSDTSGLQLDDCSSCHIDVEYYGSGKISFLCLVYTWLRCRRVQLPVKPCHLEKKNVHPQIISIISPITTSETNAVTYSDPHYLMILRDWGTQAQEKNELLRQKFNIVYDALPIMFRQGSSVFWDKEEKTVMDDGSAVEKSLKKVVVEHCNIIEPSFWKAHPSILGESTCCICNLSL